MDKSLTNEIEETLAANKQVELLSLEDETEIRSIGTESDKISLPTPLVEDVVATIQPQNLVELVSTDIRNLISKMRIPEKIKLAVFGNSIARGLLIRDPNKLIQGFVLKNPKLTSKEVEEFAKNPNLSEHVLRGIANSQTWMKGYAVKEAIVTNPKTPADLSLKWIRFLNESDLKRISKSKNVPHVVSVTAKKKIVELEKKR